MPELMNISSPPTSTDLELLSAKILRIGGIVETMINEFCTAIATANHELARLVIADESNLLSLKDEVENKIIDYLEENKPVGDELRTVLSAMKIAHELKRVGDLCVSSATRSFNLERDDQSSVIKGMVRMGRNVSRQLETVLHAYTVGDPALAERGWENEYDIDQHFRSMFDEIIETMSNDKEKVGAGAHLLFICKNLERIGDHCSNIAQIVYFRVTGEQLRDKGR